MIQFCRIDDRLIHGQVVTTWVNTYQIEQIIILNDKIAGDKMQQNILKMSAPQGINVRAFGVAKFAEIAANNPITRRTMLLFTTSNDVLKLIESGLKIDALNVGGMRYQEGRERLTKTVAVTPDEKASFKKLLDLGVDIQIQMVPKDEKIKLGEVI
ncbi:PTS system mannose/fructose/N-acetylgalactosamine-transporter subunit IIB [Isobaculum melis]|uniref:PTS system, mannose-specific IIB component n=1 Tax=Isobaculum melis TaxID=142588 RepID=A0A1H9SVG5_9LACT|nr:PTS sugar transporter subunit IIB [Isobaculum melis]SER88911.1 PTS system, mannose-specific IIB component [Isobaculum melis]